MTILRLFMQIFAQQGRLAKIFNDNIITLYLDFCPARRSVRFFMIILLLFCPAGPLGGNYHDNLSSFEVKNGYFKLYKFYEIVIRSYFSLET